MVMGKTRGSKRAASSSRNATSNASPPKHSKLANKPEKSKAHCKGNSIDGSCKLDFTSPENLLSSLIAPAANLASFFERHWEQKPLIVHRGGGSEASADYYGVCFSKDNLMSLLAEHDIQFGPDINVCRYVQSERENLNGNGRATAAKLKNLFDKKRATIQFHQPQRFQDELWRICELLESHFHSLVGANVYMTPGSSQGLAPHYDDVEVFILQLEGRKHWRLYAPPTELPRDYSGDLSQDDIGLPTHDFVLETGDLLYFPRGTVHQADTMSDSQHSTHVTISMYQRSSHGDLLALAMPNILDSAINDSVDFRKGLQVDQLVNKRAGDDNRFQNLVSQLSNHVEDHIEGAKYQMLRDFVANRLPPYRPGDLEIGPVGPMPTGNCRVRLTYPRHTLVHKVSKYEDDDEDDDDYEEENEDDITANEDAHNKDGLDSASCTVVQHSVGNSRTHHMMGTGETKPRALRFPTSFYQAINQFTSCLSDDWLESSQLCLPAGDTRDLLMSLWAEGLIEMAKD